MSNHAMILAAYDVTGIQEYIFATNRMKENVGASLIVRDILQKNLKVFLQELLGERVSLDCGANALFRMAKEPELAAEAIYIGGGNAVILYRSVDDYEAVNQKLAIALLEASYTLVLATACIEVDSFENYGKDKEALDEKLKTVKASMQRQRPMGALPIVEQEPFYGLPVSCCLGGENVSFLQALKRRKSKEISNGQLDEFSSDKMPFALEMKDLIRSEGEDGYVAIVHIDGNDMGNQIRKKVGTMGAYETAVPEMRKLSEEIAKVYRYVFEACEAELQVLAGKEGNVVLPMRPLIMDGDDITFVCRADWGIPIAAQFLRLIAREKLEPLPEISLSACAGVALSHSHFPFKVAYEIAEFCCACAKRARRETHAEDAVHAPGYLDFHLVRGAYVRDIRRARESDAAHFPYAVAEEAKHSLSALERLLLAFGEEREGRRVWSRSWLNRLHEAYLCGADAAAFVWRACKSRGVSLSDTLCEEDARAGDGMVFDALELLEFYNPSFLKKTKEAMRHAAAMDRNSTAQ